MFETKPHESRARSGGMAAMQFLAQQTFATIGTLLVTYPIFRSIEMRFLEHGSEQDPAVWSWRWTALILPMLVGFGIGVFTQKNWPSAYITGRFVGIIPTLWFARDFALAVSSFSFTRAVEISLDDAGALEMWIGALFYSLGVYWAHRRDMV